MNEAFAGSATGTTAPVQGKIIVLNLIDFMNDRTGQKAQWTNLLRQALDQGHQLVLATPIADSSIGELLHLNPALAFADPVIQEHVRNDDMISILSFDEIAQGALGDQEADIFITCELTEYGVRQFPRQHAIIYTDPEACEKFQGLIGQSSRFPAPVRAVGVPPSL